MDFTGFKDPNFGRRGRKAVSSQSAMIVYGIVAAVGVVILILVFSLISKSFLSQLLQQKIKDLIIK